MKVLSSVFSAACVCVCTAASDRVSEVDVVQDAATARVTVTYDLAEDAIVTVDVLTNGVSVGAANMKRLVGDVNRVVTAGEGKTVCWFPAKDFPGRLISDGSLSATVTAWSESSPPDYMVCDLTVTNCISYFASEDALPYDVTNDVYKTTHFVMRRIHATGRPWRMGSPEQRETGDVLDDGTDLSETMSVPHTVVLTNDYYIGVYPVTQKQYWFMTGGYGDGGESPSTADVDGEDVFRPVESVSYQDLRGTCSWPADGHAVGGSLLKIRALTGLADLDLPTDAQWEFACRAGTGSGYNNGKECTTRKTSGTACPNLHVLGWYGGNASKYGNSGGYPQPVGEKLPNAWGLYDMHGNVNEWCLDWYSSGADYTATFAEGWESGVPTLEPVGAASGTARVVRGGDYFYGPLYARSAYRLNTTPDKRSMHYGVRLACLIRNTVNTAEEE